MTTAAPVAPKTTAPAVPASKETPAAQATPEVKAPEVAADPFEKEISEKWGEDWAKLTPKMKEQVLSAERKTRDADKRYQQIAKIQKDYDLSQKQMANLVKLLKENPRAILENKALGLNIHKIAEEILWEKIQREQMDPKDRELSELKAQMAARDQEEEKAKTEREAQELAGKIEAAKAKYKGMIDAAIADEKLPNTPRVFSQMAYYIKLHTQAGKEIDMKAISGQVRKDFLEWAGQFLESAPEDQLMNLAPKGLIEKLRKADLAELRAKGLAPKPGPKPSNGVKPEPKKKESIEEWKERMRSLRTGT